MNKKTNKNDNINNILIIRLSSIGDIVLSSPIVRVLKNSYPFGSLFFITFDHFRETIIYNRSIDEKIFMSKTELKTDASNYLSKCYENLTNTKFDVIIDLQNNRYSKKIISHLNYSNLYKLNKQRLHKLSLVFLKKPLIGNYSVVENYFSCLNNDLDIQNDNLGLEFWLENESVYPTERKLKINKEKIIVSIAPGASHKTKQWLPDYFAELVNLFANEFNRNIEIRLLGSSNEIDITDYIEKKSKMNIRNFVSKTNLIASAQLIDESDLFVTNDTGLMHIAAARKVPTIAIFGSSVGELGFAHSNKNFKIIEEKMWCRPCSHIGRNRCPLLHFNCMKKIKPLRVFCACLELLNQQ